MNLPSLQLVIISKTTGFMRSKFTLGCFALFVVASLHAQNCSISAGPDTSICFGSSVGLNATGMTGPVWSPAAGLSCTACASPIASPAITTVYSVIGSQSVSAAVNGDFSQGNTGFTSSYLPPSSSTLGEGEFAINTLASNVHPGFGAFPDHTTGTGNYMIVNGSSTPGVSVWCQTIAIPANTNFTFSCWVLNLCNPIATLQFSINGIPQTVFPISTTVGVWTQFSTVWNSGASTSVTICIENMSTVLAGNDFGLDDIEFLYTCSDTDSVAVTVHPLPVANFSVSQNVGCDTVCAVFSDLSSAIAPQAITTWQWDLGDNSTGATQNPTHCYGTPGLYDVTLTVTTDEGCQATLFLTDTVIVYYPPVAAFTSNFDQTTILDPHFYFTDQSLNAVTWNWTFGSLIPGTSTLQNPDYVFDTPGVYEVCLNVTGPAGCADSVCQNVTVEDEWTLFVPNCFTPNGDGNNDIFVPVGANITEIQLFIFDRWGELIFETSGVGNGWNGIPKNSTTLAPIDVYVYKVKAVGNTGDRKVMIGSVTLMR